MTSKKIQKPSTSTSSALSPAEVVARASALVDAVAEFTDAVGLEPALTPSARQALPHARKGGERFYPTLVALAKKYDLQIPAYPVSAMEAEMQQAGKLAALRHSVTELAARLGDTERRRQADAWVTAMTTYSMLVRLAKRDGDIAQAIAPLRELFARTPKPKSAQATSTPETSAGAQHEAKP